MNEPILDESPVAAAPAALSSAAGLRRALLWLAFAAMVALLAVSVWRQRTLVLQLQQQITAQREELDEQQHALAAQQAAAVAAADALAQQRLEARQGLEDLRAEWSGGAEAFAEAQHLHAARYLVHEAALHLHIGRDAAGAQRALQAALDELAPVQGERAARLRALVSADRQTLAQLEVTSPLEVARRLHVVQTKVALLQPLKATLGNGDKGVNLIEGESGFLAMLKQTWEQNAGAWFVVHHHDEPIRTPPDLLEHRKLRLALSLALSEAQLASVHSDPLLYAESLKRARGLASAYYQDTDLGESILTDIDALLALNIAIDAFALASEQEFGA
jgi:uncharacterized protein HemX